MHIHEIEKANLWKEVRVAHAHHALKISHSLGAAPQGQRPSLLMNQVGQLCRPT